MSNMSHCRFTNTVADLRDCYDAIDDTGDLSPDEAKARDKLLLLCAKIASDYSYEIDELREAKAALVKQRR